MKFRSSLICLIGLLTLGCNHKEWTVNDNYVRLVAQVSNQSVAIYLGDTLKFKLVVPENVTTSLGQQIAISSMQDSWFGVHFYGIDTATKKITFFYGNEVLVTGGGRLQNGQAVYLSNSAKPFQATLNFIPPSKGLYYVQVDGQAGYLRVNKNSVYGLFVNFNAPNKHWELMEPYFPGFANTAANGDAAGIGCYCFRVE